MVASSCTCTMLMICLFLHHIPCVADPSWSLDFESLPCHHLSLLWPVSYMLPFNTCISPYIYCVITWLPDMLLFGKTFLLCHDLPGLYQSLAMFGCLLYHHLSCYHFTPSMIHLTLWLSRLRKSCLVIMELSATPYSVGATSRIHSLRTKCHMEQSATPLGGGHLLNLWGPPLESVGLLLLWLFIPVIW